MSTSQQGTGSSNQAVVNPYVDRRNRRPVSGDRARPSKKLCLSVILVEDGPSDDEGEHGTDEDAD